MKLSALFFLFSNHNGNMDNAYGNTNRTHINSNLTVKFNPVDMLKLVHRFLSWA